MARKPRVRGNARAPKIRRNPSGVDPDLERMRGEVTAYVRCGLNVEQIADQLGVSPRMIQDRFAHELRTAAHGANKAVAMNLFRMAANVGEQGVGSGHVDDRVQVQAATAWLKMRAGWSDKSDDAPRVNVNVLGDGPVQVNVEALDDRELEALDALVAKALPPGKS